MSPTALIVPRSHSLPTSQEEIKRASVSYPARQEPQVVRNDAPLTPPMSPKPGQHIDSMITDDRCTPIKPEANVLHQLQEANGALQVSAAELMDVDTETVEEDTPTAGVAQRLLEDEKSHLQRSGIKLADFEVRGTLGWCRLYCHLIERSLKRFFW